LKYNGFYKANELDQLPDHELQSFKKHIEEANQIANNNFMLRQSLMTMELSIKEANRKINYMSQEKLEIQEELSVCEEVSSKLNREKMIIGN